MKTTELQIGDWVKIDYNSQKVKVTAVYNNWIDTSSISPLMSKVSPIPLTPEILEKNGFELNGELPFRKEFRICFNEDTEDERHLFVEYHHKSDYVKLTYQTYTGHHNGTNGIVINHCGVHQFQHALRICGLNELADNFKVEE